MKSAVLIALAVCCVSSAGAKSTSPLIGVWKLQTYEIEFKDGSPRKKGFGDSPVGYLIFTAKRMMAILEAGDRKPWVTDEDRANSTRSMAAYTGTYRLEADKWITTVDVAWNPSYGTQQVRYYKIEGDHVSVFTDWVTNAALFPQQEVRQVLTWQRVE